MNGIVFLLAASMVGITSVRHELPNGTLQLVIQVEPTSLLSLRDGRSAATGTLQDLAGVRQVYIYLGNETRLVYDPTAIPLEGVQVGWQYLDNNSMEYLVQIPPTALDAFQRGRPVIAQLPDGLTNVSSVRVSVGTNNLPRAPLPGQNNLALPAPFTGPNEIPRARPWREMDDLASGQPQPGTTGSQGSLGLRHLPTGESNPAVLSPPATNPSPGGDGTLPLPDLNQPTGQPSAWQQPTGQQPTGQPSNWQQPSGQQPTGQQPTGQPSNWQQPPGQQPTQTNYPTNPQTPATNPGLGATNPPPGSVNPGYPPGQTNEHPLNTQNAGGPPPESPPEPISGVLLFFVSVGLALSVAGNVFLVWAAWDANARFRKLASDARSGRLIVN